MLCILHYDHWVNDMVVMTGSKYILKQQMLHDVWECCKTSKAEIQTQIKSMQ